MNLFNIMIGLCTDEAGYRLFGLIGYAIQFMQVAVPVILIVMGTIDLVKAVIASSDDKIKKAQSTLIKRAISAAVIFFVPIVVYFVIGLVADGTKSGECYWSFQHPTEAIEKANALKKEKKSNSGGTGGSSSGSATIVSKEECEKKDGTWIIDSDRIKLRDDKKPFCAINLVENIPTETTK